MKRTRFMILVLYCVCLGLSACGSTSKEKATPTDTMMKEIDTSAAPLTAEDAEESKGVDYAGTVHDGIYTSENGVMSFTLPQGFGKTDREDVVDFVSSEYPLKADNIHFTTTENSGGLTFYTKDILESVYSENSSYTDVSVSAIDVITVGGKSAVKAVMTFKMNGISVTQTQVYIECGDLIYHLYYSKLSDLEVDFESCLDSVTFSE